MTEPLASARLRLTELTPEDADEMSTVLADMALYTFMGGRPPTADELRRTYARLARGHSADGRQEWRNWILRQRLDERAVGTIQATIVDDGQAAAIAWTIGVAWQGRGYATEAARAVVAWLDDRGVETIEAFVHPDHHASAAVAARAGLTASDEFVDGERVWRRQVTQAQPRIAHTDR